MKEEIKSLKDTINEITNEKETSRQEADVLKDCLLQFRVCLVGFLQQIYLTIRIGNLGKVCGTI